MESELLQEMNGVLDKEYLLECTTRRVWDSDITLILVVWEVILLRLGLCTGVW